MCARNKGKNGLRGPQITTIEAELVMPSSVAEHILGHHACEG